LRDAIHRIIFRFTIRHASCPLSASRLREIEIWFSTRIRKPHRRGNFTSKEHLRKRIESFLAYCGATMAKLFLWAMKGKPLVA
jgi:hypothetical protein